jgi:CRISPR-associated protein Cas1
MAWRNVIISKPSRLSLQQKGLIIEQEQQRYKVPLEDIACVLIDNPQVTLTAQLLSHCAEYAVAIISVDKSHMPNGIFLPYLPHSRSLQVMQKQLSMSKPTKKRLWQHIIRQKINNQATALELMLINSDAKLTTTANMLQRQKHTINRLKKLSVSLRSGDPDNHEAQAASLYFPLLLGDSFHRKQLRFYNNALNFCYSVVRSAIARNLVIYGMLPAFGLQHHNQLNSFNLADDLIEPLRPFVDLWVLSQFPNELTDTDQLAPANKTGLVALLTQDIQQQAGNNDVGRINLLAHTEQTVISLSRHISDKTALTLAVLDREFMTAAAETAKQTPPVIEKP